MCNFEDARGDQCDSCGKLVNAVELKQPRCKVCSASPKVRTSRHIFLDLPKLESQLTEWLEKSSKDWTHNARVIAKSWIKTGLQIRCITRDLKWGTPVPKPGFEDKVFYVWYDAPLGYVSITANYTPEWERWWKKSDSHKVEYFEFMAKDNVPFHSVIFPACQLGTGEPWTMVDRLMATEYLNYEDTKFSKSRGIGVFGDQARDTGIDSDVWRFYLVYTRPEGQDSSFKWDDILLKTNSELLGNLGNFINRALKFCKDSFNGVVGAIKLTDEDQTCVAMTARHLSKYVELMEDCCERDAIREMLSISRLGNQLMQSNKPWKLVKNKGEERASSVIGLAINMVALLSQLMEPFLPQTAEILWKQLAVTRESFPILGKKFVCLLPPGHRIGDPAPLVKEIKADQMDALKEKFGRGKSQAAAVQDPAKIKQLEEAVAKQGNVVRELKADKADKDVVKGEVDRLLDLKKQLAAASRQGGDGAQEKNKEASSKKGKKGKKR